MISRECFENKWFYMKYIEKYLSGEILLARECRLVWGPDARGVPRQLPRVPMR